MLCHIETDSFFLQRFVQDLQTVCRCDIQTSDSSGIQNDCFRVIFDMLLDILLQHPDIGKKQIAAETVNQNSLHRMDLAAFPQISKMLMPRLDSQKTSCRF